MVSIAATWDGLPRFTDMAHIPIAATFNTSISINIRMFLRLDNVFLKRVTRTFLYINGSMPASEIPILVSRSPDKNGISW